VAVWPYQFGRIAHSARSGPDNRPVNDTYTTREVARMLGMAVRSVQLMVDRGDLEAWKTPGGHRRISRVSVERWQDERGLRGAAPVAAGLTTPTSALGASAALPTAPQRTPVAPSVQAPIRVLLIEDSIHYQNLVGLLLRQQFPDVELHMANDGIAGLAMAGQLQPQVLVVDILLPGIDGATLITSLRSHPQFAGTRLIVVTSLDETQREPYAFALAGVPVVHKPRLVAELPPLLRASLAGPVGAALAPQSAARVR
jgi:excisionase family DNA binding protein